MKQSNTLPSECRHIEHMHEGVTLKQILLTKGQLLELRTKFQLVLNRGYASAMIVHTWADQLSPQLLIEQFDTLPSHYRHFRHFICLDPCILNRCSLFGPHLD